MNQNPIYRRRFPIRQKRADGTYGCRGCGNDIPKGRKTWCSTECNKRFNPNWVRISVRNRDKDVCAICGFDCRSALNTWESEKYKPGWNYSEWLKRKPDVAEYDHIIPFSEGGLTVVENMRTLCKTCHNKRTSKWRKRKKKVLAQTGHRQDLGFMQS
jgi:HNH endonuclease